VRKTFELQFARDHQVSRPKARIQPRYIRFNHYPIDDRSPNRNEASWKVIATHANWFLTLLLNNTGPWIASTKEQLGGLPSPLIYERVSCLSTNHQYQNGSLAHFCLARLSSNGSVRSDRGSRNASLPTRLCNSVAYHITLQDCQPVTRRLWLRPTNDALCVMLNVSQHASRVIPLRIDIQRSDQTFA
jgi:hypothetical protein